MKCSPLGAGQKRDVFLRRIAAIIALRGRGRFTDTDVAEVAQLTLTGLPSTGGLNSELLAGPAIQNNNPDHGGDHQRATES